MTATLLQRLRGVVSYSPKSRHDTTCYYQNPDGLGAAGMTAVPPIDLLRELKRVFEHDGSTLRKEAQIAFSELQRRAIDARAYACEQAVVKIDETLKEYSCR